MKYLILIFLITSSAQLISAQSVTITDQSAHANNNMYTFPIQNGTLAQSNNRFVFGEAQINEPASWSVSAYRNRLAFLQQEHRIYLRSFDYSGRLLLERELEFFDPDDTTLKVYQFNDGSVAIRDNVANFSFFDSIGREILTVSNFSQSPDGERESRLASDQAGRAIVLYNPVIAYGADTGSRARILSNDGQMVLLYQDNSREIKQLAMSDDGVFITIHTTNSDDDTVFVFDRFGNELFSYHAAGLLNGAVLSSGGEYLTTFSNTRMQVFRISDNERLGSASSRNHIIYATYFPEDEMLISFNGNQSDNRVTRASITAVHVTKRQIASEDISFQLSQLKPDRVALSRLQESRFRLDGLNRKLIIDTHF